MWCTGRQQPIKVGIWYTANRAGVGRGGLLGYGISHFRGSISSWKYESLIIGALCCVWGFSMFFFLPDSRVSPKTLTMDIDHGREKNVGRENSKESNSGVEQDTQAISDMGGFSTLKTPQLLPYWSDAKHRQWWYFQHRCYHHQRIRIFHT
jgi:hypothetical protein